MVFRTTVCLFCWIVTWVVAFSIGGKQIADRVLFSDPKSPLYYSMRARDNPNLHSSNLEGSR